MFRKYTRTQQLLKQCTYTHCFENTHVRQYTRTHIYNIFSKIHTNTNNVFKQWHDPLLHKYIHIYTRCLQTWFIHLRHDHPTFLFFITTLLMLFVTSTILWHQSLPPQAYVEMTSANHLQTQYKTLQNKSSMQVRTQLLLQWPWQLKKAIRSRAWFAIRKIQ